MGYEAVGVCGGYEEAIAETLALILNASGFETWRSPNH